MRYNLRPPACRECLVRETRANIARYVPTFAQGASEASGCLGMTGLALDNESSERLPLTHAPPRGGIRAHPISIIGFRNLCYFLKRPNLVNRYTVITIQKVISRPKLFILFLWKITNGISITVFTLFYHCFIDSIRMFSHICLYSCIYSLFSF